VEGQAWLKTKTNKKWLVRPDLKEQEDVVAYSSNHSYGIGKHSMMD
jgi:hypothetical protein